MVLEVLQDWVEARHIKNTTLNWIIKINILDPDAFVFGGGVSNEIDFLHEIDSLVRKFVIGREYEGVFLKPRYGDASGVRGAARLGRSATYWYFNLKLNFKNLKYFEV